MMFSSIESRDLPYRAGQAVTVYEATLNGKPASLVIRDHVQHNEPNPILVRFRLSPRGAEDFLWLLGSPASTRVTYGVEQSNHARKVLTRLTALTKENTAA